MQDLELDVSIYVLNYLQGYNNCVLEMTSALRAKMNCVYVVNENVRDIQTQFNCVMDTDIAL